MRRTAKTAGESLAFHSESVNDHVDVFSVVNASAFAAFIQGVPIIVKALKRMRRFIWGVVLFVVVRSLLQPSDFGFLQFLDTVQGFTGVSVGAAVNCCE